MSAGDWLQIAAIVVILGYCLWRAVRYFVRISRNPGSGGCSGCSLSDVCNKENNFSADRNECKKSDKGLHNSKH